MILVPLLSLTPRSPSGTTFVREILPLLVRALAPERVVISCDEAAEKLLANVPATFERRRVPDRRVARLLAARVAIPSAVRRHRPRALYVPDGQIIGAPVTVPAVIALHFHINFSRPHDVGLARRAYWKLFYDRAVRRTARRAAALLAPTRAFEEEFLEHVPEAGGRTHVVHHGVGAAFLSGGAQRDEGARPYVLVVSNRFAYKNLPGAARIFAEACRDLPHDLHVAGLAQGDVRDLLASARPGADASRIRALGHLAPAELAHQYRGAAALLFPSFEESFGLPIVEAMACGTPVVCSRLPALLEVSGGAAALADPNDEAGFARALREVLTDGTRAAAMASAGLERSRAFTWEEAARRTAEILAGVDGPGVFGGGAPMG